MEAAKAPQFHPLYQSRLHLVEGMPGPGIADDPDTGERRRAFDAPFREPQLPEVDTYELALPGPNGPVRVRVFLPVAGSDQPAAGLVWIHGGGFMYNDIDVPESDHFGRHMAHRTGTVVVSVDYRLCNATVHLPVPHDDCYAVYTWVRQHASELGIDPSRLAVGGGSAGGTLAGSVALHAGEAGQMPWQMLLAYPVLHPTLPEPDDDLRSALAVAPPALLFTPEACISVNEFVLGRPVSAATPYDFPALAADYTKFPPAYIENCEFDSLRSSGEAFAADLAAAGVDVELVTARGVPHGHLNAVGSPMLEDAYTRFAARLQDGPTRQ